MNGQDHHCQDEPGGKHADAVGRACKQRRENGDIAKNCDEKRLQRLLQKRREYEQAPDAVNDAGDPGKELDCDADRAAQPHRAKFGEKYRNQQSDRDCQQNRNGGSDERAVDRCERTEPVGYRVPPFLDQKIQAKSAPYGQ
jgi:hypothetical protein